MNETILIDGLTFQIKRSKRRKTIGLTVERDSSLVAHLPDEADIGQASDLIRTKLVWVHQKLESRKDTRLGNVFRRPEFVDGEGFHFLGKHYRLKLVDVGSAGRPAPTVRFDGDRLLFRREQVAAGEKRIAEHYTRAAHPYLNSAVKRWKLIVGVRPAKYVQVMDLGFRWASCSSDGTLNFHWRVMQLPPQVIDYVVVHELCHLRVRDHSPAFWREVARVLPSYEILRNWLRDKGGDL
ncbi:M48 family metallopeptidase [Neorhizobium galegae]|uniref:M48 family metallopeptidase n=1 Tax=Neorhizobium galegae TaxID=399 RepID=UPI0006229CEE|nr:SprT family zinc-dependent metalloprotease [Neorhizobium galegae]CDZ54494.1 Zinc metalloprotease [Neorhizobium galegae bv. orientalis]